MLNQHHKLYRFPVKAELWEDIFDQSINGWDSKWEGGGHSVGADVISEDVDRTRYQNKSGSININKNIIKWNGHRTTTHKTIEDKINFISKPHYDKLFKDAYNIFQFVREEKKLGTAIIEAIAASIELIVCITEGIPILDMLKVRKKLDG